MAGGGVKGVPRVNRRCSLPGRFVVVSAVDSGRCMMVFEGPVTNVRFAQSWWLQRLRRSLRHHRPDREEPPSTTERLSRGTHYHTRALLAFDQQNGSWVVQIRCRITASFLATAILALVSPIRCASRTPHALRDE
jgi:hypothetical protein